MNTRKIAESENIDRDEFEEFLKNNPDFQDKIDVTFLGDVILDDFYIPRAVEEFKISKEYIKLDDIAYNEELDAERLRQTAEEYYRSQVMDDGTEIFISRKVNINELLKKYFEKYDKGGIPKSSALSNILITSGFSFDGYTITKYSGYISGDGAAYVDPGGSHIRINGARLRDIEFDVSRTSPESELMKAISKIRREAVYELKQAAYDLGCNAVIGLDFDYINLSNVYGSQDRVSNSNILGVTANGNAVIIEKNKNSGRR